MSEPPVLNYSSGSNLPPPPGRRLFAPAFWIGVAFSAVVWIAISSSNFNSIGVLIFTIVAVPGLKLLLSIILLCFRQYRSAGAGLLASLPVGVGIFFSMCAIKS
jgi:hypothetical protein